MVHSTIPVNASFVNTNNADVNISVAFDLADRFEPHSKSHWQGEDVFIGGNKKKYINESETWLHQAETHLITIWIHQWP